LKNVTRPCYNKAIASSDFLKICISQNKAEEERRGESRGGRRKERGEGRGERGQGEGEKEESSEVVEGGRQKEGEAEKGGG
jgi:hypothetical protein